MPAGITLRSRWRFPAMAAAAATAAIHVSQFASTWQESAPAGAGFLALAAICAAGSVALAVRDTPLTWLVMAATCAAATAGYAFSRTIGLPGMADDIGNWGEPAGVAAVASQVLLVIAAAASTAAPSTATSAKDS